MKRRRSSARACCDCQANPYAAPPADPAPTPCRLAPAPPPHPPGEGRGLNKYSGQLAEVAIALNTHEMRRPMATPSRAAVSRRRESDGGMADYL